MAANEAHEQTRLFEERLQAASTELTAARHTLEQLRSERADASATIAHQQEQLAALTASLEEQKTVMSRERELLAAGRDVRDLMGARNLHVWTSYDGVDPESNFGAGDLQTDFMTAGPPRYYNLRLNIHY